MKFFFKENFEDQNGVSLDKLFPLHEMRAVNVRLGGWTCPYFLIGNYLICSQKAFLSF